MCHRAHRHDSLASSVVVMKTHQEAHRKHREVPAEVPSCSQREHGAGQDASQLLSQRATLGYTPCEPSPSLAVQHGSPGTTAEQP